MKLLLIRHGSTRDNEQNRYSGQANVPLSPLGERQVAALSRYLAAEVLDVIVTSDLQRASRTASAIAHHHELPMYEDTDLREICMGDWEGATHSEMLKQDPDLMSLWQSNPAHCRLPGGETLIEIRQRVLRALERWYTHYPVATVVWVTHGGVIRVLLCHLLRIDLNQWRRFYPENASIIEVKMERSANSSLDLTERPYMIDVQSENRSVLHF